MLNLSRVDYTQLPTCSARGTLQLLPFGGHKRQKVVVGTDEMTVVCLAMKQFECKTVFDTSLSTEKNMVVPISSIHIQSDTQKIYAASGTSVSGINKKGKVYYSLKSNVAENIQNIQVQGRVILASGEYVLVSLDETGKELHYYRSPDRINDLYKMGDVAVLGCQDSTLRIVQNGTLSFEVALSGAVRSLTELSTTPIRARTVKDEDTDRKKGGSMLGRFRKGKKKDTEGKTNQDMDAGGKTSTATDGGGEEGKNNETTKNSQEGNNSTSEGKSNTALHGESTLDLDASFVYGTTTGGIGAVNIEDGVARKSWFLPPPRSGEASAANCIRVDDVTGDGVNDMIVARDNGLVQVFSLGEGNDATGRNDQGEMMFSAQGQQWSPTLCVEHEVGESVRSLDVGVVRTPGYDELVVCTYSGRVLSLTTESLSDRAADDKYGRSKAIVGKETQVKAFRSELKDLHKQVQRESEKLNKLHPSKKSNSNNKNNDDSSGFIPMENQFSVNHSFQLMEHDATYQLVMEIPIPISEVILQTTVPVDLLRQDDEATVIMCRTKSVSLTGGEVGNNSGGNGNNNGGNNNGNGSNNTVPQVLATYRPTEKNTRRIKLGLRSIEGQHGELHVYVVSDLKPKMARVLKFAIKPLSMHSRINGLESRKEQNIPWNELTFTGNFTIGQAHSWLSFCLPDIPPHYSATSADSGDSNRIQAKVYFRNAFVGSHLVCVYEDGEARFRSDSVTTITILKQVITQHATNLNQNVQVSTNINNESVEHFLKLLHPKLQAQFQLSRQMQLVQSMAELTELNEGIPNYLDEELKYVMANSKDIKLKFDDSKRILEILYGMVADMYIDVKQQTMGVHSNSQIPILMGILQNYDHKTLVDFFRR